MPQHWRISQTQALVVNIAYAMLLVAASVMTSLPRVPGLTETDWLAHGLAYFGQTVLLYLLFRWRMSLRSALVAATSCAFGFGFAMELVQLSLPERFFELLDVVANAVGIAIGVAVVAIAAPSGRRRRQP